MPNHFIPVLLLDADGQLESQLLPLCKSHRIDLFSIRILPRGYQNLYNLLTGGKYSVLLIDESFHDYIYGIGLIRLQQDFPDIEIMMFGTKIEVKQNDTYRFFKKPVEPEIVVWNIKLAARKNQIARRKGRALLILQEASVSIVGKDTENDVLKSMVHVASRIMDDSDRTGYFSHLAVLNEDNYLVYVPEHHSQPVYSLLQKSLKERVHVISDRESYPAIKLEETDGRKVGIVGMAIRENRTQRVDDVTKIDQYIILHETVCSQISIPIAHNDQIFGVLTVEYPEANAFDENDQFAFEALASIIGVAIEQNRLNERERKQSRALEVLAHMGEWVGVSIQLTRDQIFQETVVQAGALMDAKDPGYLVHLGLLAGQKLVFSPLHHDSQVLQKINQKIGGVIDLEHPPVFDGSPRRGIIGRAVQEGVILNVSDVSLDPDYIPFSDNTKSQLAVPIIQDDRIIGAINIEHARKRAFDELDEQNLNSLALYIGLALSNADLYAQASKRAEQYEMVYRAGQMISQYNELQAVVDELAEQALRIVGDGARGREFFSHVSVLEDGHYLRIRSINPSALPDIYSDQNNVFNIEINLKQHSKLGISGQALLRGTELNVGDVSKFADHFLPIVPGINSQLSVPIIEGSNLIGVISIESNEFDRFSNEDVEKVKLIARMGAIAIENSRRVSLEKNKTNNIRYLTISLVFLAFTVLAGFFLPFLAPSVSSGNQGLLNLMQIVNSAVQLILSLASIGGIMRRWIVSRLNEQKVIRRRLA